MLKIKKFTFNAFAENTYILYSEKGNAWIIDPGCSNANENREVLDFLEDNKLILKALLLTHAHIDHILGNHFIYQSFELKPQMHQLEIPVLERGKQSASMYGIPYLPSPEAKMFIKEGETLILDNHELEVLWCPGHAPGHLVFVSHKQEFVIGGDVLFRESIGRTDLPGGNHETLLNSISTKIYTLPDNYTVFCGHGPETSIGHEKHNNPFIRG